MTSAHRKKWLPLAAEGDLSKWVLDPGDAIAHDGDALLFTDKDVKGEVGGMSWDNYVLSAEVLLTRLAKDWYFQVELTAVGTCVYCQLLPTCVVLCSYLDGGKGDKDQLAIESFEVKEEVWHEFQMVAQEGRIKAIFDGHEVANATSPLGTAGMAGFVVKFIKNAQIRIRSLRLRFLSPTMEQINEYGRDAVTNWRNFEESQGTAQLPWPRRNCRFSSGLKMWFSSCR